MVQPERVEGEYCYTLEFDGASKGNPGAAGSGALLRDATGKAVGIMFLFHPKNTILGYV